MILKFIMSLAGQLLDFVYPPVCISCNELLSDGNRKICINCWNNIPTLSKNNILYQETRNKLMEQGCVDDLVSCFVFEQEGPSQHIAHALKYREYKSIGIELGKKIGNLIQIWNINVDVIIPVPLHKIKFRERGYNQSEYIALGISQVVKKPVVLNAVRRIRNTKTQTKLNLNERYKNMKDAFEIQNEAWQKLKGQNCLLVDDIITTGATVNSCAKMLAMACPNSIIAASAALAK